MLDALCGADLAVIIDEWRDRLQLSVLLRCCGDGGGGETLEIMICSLMQHVSHKVLVALSV